MSKQTEALKLAEEALMEATKIHASSCKCSVCRAVIITREALAEQPASKPLTDEEIKRMAAPLFMSHYWSLCNEFARAIEAKLREKNNG